jgi:hypothetical protein
MHSRKFWNDERLSQSVGDYSGSAGRAASYSGVPPAFLRSWVTGTSFFRDITYLNPPQLPILEHAPASAAPGASYHFTH